MKLINSVAIAALAVTAWSCDRGNDLQETEVGTGYSTQSEIIEMTDEERTSPTLNQGTGATADEYTGTLSGTADSDTTDFGSGATANDDQSSEAGAGASAESVDIIVPAEEIQREEETIIFVPANSVEAEEEVFDNTSSEGDVIQFQEYEGSGTTDSEDAVDYDNSASESDNIEFLNYEGINDEGAR